MYKAFILILYVILSGVMYIFFVHQRMDNMIIARIYIRNIGDFKELLVMCLC